MNNDVYQQKNKIILHIRDVGPFNSVWDVFLIIYDTLPVKVMFLSLLTTSFFRREFSMQNVLTFVIINSFFDLLHLGAISLKFEYPIR